MSLGLIIVILLIIFLLGGFSGRFGGYGYGYGHGGVGVIGVVLIIMLVLLLGGRIENLVGRWFNRPETPSESDSNQET